MPRQQLGRCTVVEVNTTTTSTTTTLFSSSPALVTFMRNTLFVSVLLLCLLLLSAATTVAAASSSFLLHHNNRVNQNVSSTNMGVRVWYYFDYNGMNNNQTDDSTTVRTTTATTTTTTTTLTSAATDKNNKKNHNHSSNNRSSVHGRKNERNSESFALLRRDKSKLKWKPLSTTPDLEMYNENNRMLHGNNHNFYISDPVDSLDNQYVVLKYLLSRNINTRNYLFRLYSDDKCGQDLFSQDITSFNYFIVDEECCGLEEEHIPGYDENTTRTRKTLTITLQMHESIRTSSMYTMVGNETPQVLFCVELSVYNRNVFTESNVTEMNHRDTVIWLELKSPRYLLPVSMVAADFEDHTVRLRAGIVEIILFSVFAVVGCLYFCSRGGVETTTKVVGELVVVKEAVPGTQTIRSLESNFSKTMRRSSLDASFDGSSSIGHFRRRISLWGTFNSGSGHSQQPSGRKSDSESRTTNKNSGQDQ